ncbi:Uncharacterized protein dnm_075650 [Desulfonema magnum]|uniref:Uncharacterized protein n=1 Tax=Desulfonema magnum TaxID=45655 RepID=A0A975GS32_9BACT|nr:Uncharacterized protein dnm_075650 [Desulfonema magnum]
MENIMVNFRTKVSRPKLRPLINQTVVSSGFEAITCRLIS